MRRRTLVLVGLAAGVAVTAAVTAAFLALHSTSTPDSAILFARKEQAGKRWDVYVMRADGTDVRLLARDAADPVATRDGKRIAFVRKGEIWEMARDGSTQRRLTHGGAIGDVSARGARFVASHPAWAPDGKTLFFARTRGRWSGTSEIVAIRDGSGLTLLAQAVRKPCSSPDPHDCNYIEGTYERVSDPAPCPDGLTVAFTRGAFDYSYLDGIRAAPRGLRTYHLDWASDPACSPDGAGLAYYSPGDEPGPPTLHSSGVFVSRRGESQALLVAPAGFAPAWSPDGRWLTFVDLSHDDGPGGADRLQGVDIEPAYGVISLARPDGSELAGLGQLGATPAWLPALASDG